MLSIFFTVGFAVTHEYSAEYDIAAQGVNSRSEEVFSVLDGCNGGFSDNCAILFFIILFLLLFRRRGYGVRAFANEVE